MKYQNSVFLFRRDLRIEDNTGLIEASKNSRKVFPCFFGDPKIINNFNRSEFRTQFYLDSIRDLVSQFKKKDSILHLFFGNPTKILEYIFSQLNIDAVFINHDYSPASIQRDSRIYTLCKRHKVEMFSFHDSLLHGVNKIKTQNGKPYTIFTQFYKKAKRYPVRKPQFARLTNFYRKKLKDECSIENIYNKAGIVYENNDPPNGGRQNALKILSNLEKYENYDEERNFPYLNGTTRLSAHNRFGTCSIREIHNQIVEQIGPEHSLITELYWRDFFSYVMYHFPTSFKDSFRKKYSKFPWKQNRKNFEKWCKGITGFPIVDAGMRELNQTGYMHNRVRMIVASFLTKDLHIDWKMGERYFAKKLIDYDPCVNVGNWQWAASTGCDSQPWFRIFNPWLQQKKYDPDCKYIKKWIPELSDLSFKEIHDWKNRSKPSKNYPLPMIDHEKEAILTKELFKKKW